MNDDMTYDEAISHAKSIDEDRKLIKAIRYPIETLALPEIRGAMRMAADDLLDGTITMVDFTGIWRRCRARTKAGK